jgi:exo-beta-1,3-glucanase (GH17 family)
LRDLAVMFSQTGYPAEGIPFGLQALQLAPEDQKSNIQELVTAMETQAAP